MSRPYATDKTDEELAQMTETVLNKIREGEALITLNEIRHNNAMKYEGQITLSEKVIHSTINKVYFVGDYVQIDFSAEKKDRNDLLAIKSLLELHRGKFTQAIKQNENRIYDLLITLCKTEGSDFYRLDANKPMLFVLDDSDERVSILRVVFLTKDVGINIEEVDTYKVEEEYQYYLAQQEEAYRDELAVYEDEDDETGYDEGLDDTTSSV